MCYSSVINIAWTRFLRRFRAFLGVSNAIDEVWHNDSRIHKQEIYALDGKF